jgi:hypothetical protein
MKLKFIFIFKGRLAGAAGISVLFKAVSETIF